MRRIAKGLLTNHRWISVSAIALWLIASGLIWRWLYVTPYLMFSQVNEANDFKFVGDDYVLRHRIVEDKHRRKHSHFRLTDLRTCAEYEIFPGQVAEEIWMSSKFGFAIMLTAKQPTKQQSLLFLSLHDIKSPPVTIATIDKDVENLSCRLLESENIFVARVSSAQFQNTRLWHLPSGRPLELNLGDDAVVRASKNGRLVLVRGDFDTFADTFRYKIIDIHNNEVVSQFVESCQVEIIPLEEGMGFLAWEFAGPVVRNAQNEIWRSRLDGSKRWHLRDTKPWPLVANDAVLPMTTVVADFQDFQIQLIDVDSGSLITQRVMDEASDVRGFSDDGQRVVTIEYPRRLYSPIRAFLYRLIQLIYVPPDLVPKVRVRELYRSSLLLEIDFDSKIAFVNQSSNCRFIALKDKKLETICVWRVPSSGCYGRIMFIIGAVTTLAVESARRRWCRSRGVGPGEKVHV
jgi:hypothetical protein